MCNITALTTLVSQHYRVFLSTKGHARVKFFHTFLFPCFIHDPKLCQKKYILTWTPQSRQAFYLGILTQSAGSVYLVINLKTRYISPQFYIGFDDYFTTTNARITNKNPRQLEQYFQKPSWTTNKGVPVHHRKTTEKPDWPFRGRTQGKQQLILWPFRGRPQGKQQLNFWSDRVK